MRLLTFCATVALGLVLFSPPLRAENPLYLFGKVGKTSVDADIGREFASIIDGDDESLGFGLGFRLGEHFAFEAQHQDFGSVPGLDAVCADPEVLCLSVPLEADTKAISVAALAHFSLTQRFLLYGKLGVISWETDLSEVPSDIGDILESVDDEDVVYGLGLRFILPGAFDFFAEVERFADSFDTVSLGATLGF